MHLKVSQEILDKGEVFELSSEEVRLLLRLAFVAMGRKRFVGAERLLELLECFRPNADALVAARAVFFIAQRDFRSCLSYLEHVRSGCKLFPMADLFRGVALQHLGERFAAQTIYAMVAEQIEDEVAARFAKDALVSV